MKHVTVVPPYMRVSSWLISSVRSDIGRNEDLIAHAKTAFHATQYSGNPGNLDVAQVNGLRSYIERLEVDRAALQATLQALLAVDQNQPLPAWDEDKHV